MNRAQELLMMNSSKKKSVKSQENIDVSVWLIRGGTELYQECRNTSWLTFLPQRRLWRCIIHQRRSHTGAAGRSAPKNLILNEWNTQALQSFAPCVPDGISTDPHKHTNSYWRQSQSCPARRGWGPSGASSSEVQTEIRRVLLWEILIRWSETESWTPSCPCMD